MARQRDRDTGRYLAADPPKTTRVQLGQAILRDVLATWDARGAQALVMLAEEDPTAFVKLAASLLPKETEPRGGDPGEAFLRMWRAISEGAVGEPKT